MVTDADIERNQDQAEEDLERATEKCDENCRKDCSACPLGAEVPIRGCGDAHRGYCPDDEDDNVCPSGARPE